MKSYHLNNQNKLLLISTLINLIYICNCQQTLLTLSIVEPTDCGQNQYYDISHLTCTDCPQNTAKSDRIYILFCLL